MTTLTETPAQPERASLITLRTLLATVALILIVALADIALWMHRPGTGVAVLFGAVTLATLAVNAADRRSIRSVVLTGATLLVDATFAEVFTLQWVIVALVCNGALALQLSGRLARFEEWLGPLVGFGVLAPVRLVGDVIRILAEAGRLKLGNRLWRLLLVWMIPALFGLIFIGLFAAANPLIDDALRLIRLDAVLNLVAPERVIFWGVVAVAMWPVLAPQVLTFGTERWQGPRQPAAPSLIFGEAAIRNALVVFNALFAVQTVLDLVYLWGGVRLPDGLSYAEYAHRGAYPLIVTALLAAGFVLAAMRRGGPGENSALLRVLVYLWVGQNVWLVVSSILRLKLYVDEYMLTDLRLYAGVWMGLVAIGLVLIITKVALRLSNRWLIMANLLSLAVTLWLVVLVNVPAQIAWFNVLHSREMGGSGQGLDFYQMSDLGPEAIPALDSFLAKATFDYDDDSKQFRLLRGNLTDAITTAPADWQGWTWRTSRLKDYLARYPDAPDSKLALHRGAPPATDDTVSMPEGPCRGC